MTAPATAAPVIFRSARLAPVIHEAGTRVTRTTWAACLEYLDGTVVYCEHRDGHRTRTAAADCCRTLARRLVREHVASEETR